MATTTADTLVDDRLRADDFGVVDGVGFCLDEGAVVVDCGAVCVEDA